jgi:hypothetical protein
MRTALHLGVVEQVCLVEHDDGAAAAFGVFGGECCGGLRDEGGGVEAGHLPERGDDVVQHAPDSDRGVGQVDDHVPGGVQRGGRGPDGHRLSGADLAGDDTEGVLVDAPSDAGHGFGVPVVAVQHRRGQATAERHPGETPMGLQTLHAHFPAACSSVRASSIDICPGSLPGAGAGAGDE